MSSFTRRFVVLWSSVIWHIFNFYYHLTEVLVEQPLNFYKRSFSSASAVCSCDVAVSK